MIILHVGKIGEGKSYSCTWEVWKWLKKGVDVYVNWNIDMNKYLEYKERSIIWRFLNRKRQWGNLYHFKELDEIYQMRNGQIYVDEAHRWLNARDYEKTPPDFIARMSQSRKFKTDLHFICQYPDQIEKVVRKLCNEVIVHKRFFWFFTYKTFDGKFIDKIDADPAKPPPSLMKGWTWFRPSFAKVYNTFEILGKEFEKYNGIPLWNKEIYQQYKNSKVIDSKLAKLRKSVLNIWHKKTKNTNT